MVINLLGKFSMFFPPVDLRRVWLSEANMIRCAFPILLVMSAILSPAAQTPSKLDDFPLVSVLLPANIPSETVQISYALIGPFGGYGGHTKQRPGLQSYEISALIEGKTASEIRMIVYASGCEIKTFVLPVARGSRLTEEFECQSAATVQLSGQILPTELVRESNAELVVFLHGELVAWILWHSRWYGY